MPVVTVLPDRLEIRLTTAERILALRRADVVVDRANIRSATVTEDPWVWVRGIRAPGTAVPLTIATGSWKFHGGKDFLLIKRSTEAVVVDLVDEEFSRIVISTRHASELISALQPVAATSAVPGDAEEGNTGNAEGTDAEGTDAEGSDAETEPTGTPEPFATLEDPAGSKAEGEPRVAPAARPRRVPRTDPSVGHSSEEPSGATEAAE